MAGKPKPPESSADVEALKHLMAWSREQGYAFDTATIGSVQITGFRDLDPSVKARENAAAQDDARRRVEEQDDGTIYDQVGRDLPGYELVRGERPA